MEWTRNGPGLDLDLSLTIKESSKGQSELIKSLRLVPESRFRIRVRKMKIECSRQVFATLTPFVEILPEPKNILGENKTL